MVAKIIVAVILSLGAQFLGGFLAVAGYGIVGKTDMTVNDGVSGAIGQLLFFGAPIAAAFYIAKTYHASKGIEKRRGKKALIYMLTGIIIVIGAFPAVLLGEVISEQWASWRNKVCVTQDNVSYDFEFGGIYSEYELAFQALRDDAPQEVRKQAGDIIDTRIVRAYEECAEGRISPLAEREQLQAAFDDFSQLAEPYRD
jgi:hypothetical protein